MGKRLLDSILLRQSGRDFDPTRYEEVAYEVEIIERRLGRDLLPGEMMTVVANEIPEIFRQEVENSTRQALQLGNTTREKALKTELGDYLRVITLGRQRTTKEGD